MKKTSFLFFYFVILVILSACSSANITVSPENNNTPIVTEAGEVAEERILNICISEEPESLFLYADNSNSAESIFQAIYDGPMDSLSWGLQPVILEKVPSLADGDARFDAIQVNRGELIVDASGELVQLAQGVSYLPSGCKDIACSEIYIDEEGGLATMDQMVVAFKLLPNIKWSDGKELVASDSVYSFEIAKSLGAASNSDLISRTFSYESVDSNVVAWRGLPGYRDPNYAGNFFTPLPKHVLQGLSVDELISNEASARLPLGYGAYYVTDWAAGESIQLSKNAYYFKAGAGLQNFDSIVYQFVGTDSSDAVAAILDGKCDVLDESVLVDYQDEQVQELVIQGRLLLASAPGKSWEHLDFGIVPISYDEIYNVAQGDRPNYFGDVRTRQAIAYCLDQQAIVDQVTYGLGEVMSAYITSSNPLFNTDAPNYPYDVNAGTTLLEQAGWVTGEAGIRISQGVNGIPDGIPLEFGYFTTESRLHLAIANFISKNLSDCGIKVNIATGTPQELFAPGPTGLLFGRQFDVAQFAWPFEDKPSCYLYFGDAVPGANIEDFPYSWGGWNLTGWKNADFDAACRRALAAMPGEPDYESAHFLAQLIFMTELPIIPLYAAPIVVLARPDFCGLSPDATENVFWNIEALNYGAGCE